MLSYNRYSHFRVPQVFSAILLVVIVCFCNVPSHAEEYSVVNSLDIFPGRTSVTIKIRLDKPSEYHTTESSEPLGLIIEFPEAISKVSAKPFRVNREPVRRVAVYNSNNERSCKLDIQLMCPARWEINNSEDGKNITVKVSKQTEIEKPTRTATRRTSERPRSTKNIPPKPRPAISRAKMEDRAPSTGDILECSFKDTELTDVIQVIGKIAGVNIIADSSVQGKITLNLSDISWEEGLGTTLKSLGYSLRKDGNVYVVSKTPPERAPTVKVEDDRIYISATATDTKRLLNLISEKSGLNIVTGPSVDGKISVRLSGVPVEDGVYTFLSANGYTFKKLGDIYVVDKLERGKNKPPMRPYKEKSTDGMVTIDYKDTELSEVLDELSAQTGKNIVTYGQLSDRVTMRLMEVPLEEALKLVLAGTKYTSKQIDTVFVVGDASNLSSPVSQMLTETTIIPLKYIRAEESLKHLSGIIPTANLKPLSEQNALLVVGTEEMIARIKKEIALIDKVAPQVMIEAQVVEVSSNATKNLGYDLKYDQGAYSARLPGTGAVVYTSTENVSKSLMITLQALLTEGKARMLANPKITTINGKEANITMSQQRYFRTTYVPEDNNNSTPYYYPYSQVQSVEAGIMLRIVPYVGASEEITVDIEPEVSTVTGTGPDGLPEISRRRARTTVRVRNGETIVIGGLKQREHSKAITRTPILSDIPIIGELFTTETKNTRDADLMILITPTLIYPAVDSTTPTEAEEADGGAEGDG